MPEFVFMVYRRDITDNPNLSPEDKQQLGGGFLAFTVDLSVDDALLNAAKPRLAAISGGTAVLAGSVPQGHGPALHNQGHG